jgi:hypothetical protein
MAEKPQNLKDFPIYAMNYAKNENLNSGDEDFF